MTLASCIYEGTVRHRRDTPIRHEFRQRLFLMYLDLEELPTLFRKRWLWSAASPAIAWFRRSDHFGPVDQDLAESVRDIIQERSGTRPTGPIRLLTSLRYAGFVMNPISLFYCYDLAGNVTFVVAEVTNTPWGERHLYVLDVRDQQSGQHFEALTSKQMHVSPFLSMDYNYRFSITKPGPRLAVHIKNLPADLSDAKPTFDATLLLHRHEITGRSLASALVRYPFMTAQIYAGIYWQAFRLWRKGAPLFNHPPAHNATAPHDDASQDKTNSLPGRIAQEKVSK
ncbi:DUF1365 domain-containing protein [Lacunimicrobium album]